MSYEVVAELNSFREVTALIKDGEWWLLCGTGGWHGTVRTLEDAERVLKNEDETFSPAGAYVTVFLFNPEQVLVRYGEIRLKNLNEVNYLRNKVSESLDKIYSSQAGSLPEKEEA